MNSRLPSPFRERMCAEEATASTRHVPDRQDNGPSAPLGKARLMRAEAAGVGHQHTGSLLKELTSKHDRRKLDHLPDKVTGCRILDTAEAAEFCRFSVPHWRRLYRSGKVPRPVRLSARKYGWRLGDLVDWIEASRTSSAEMPKRVSLYPP